MSAPSSIPPRSSLRCTPPISSTSPPSPCPPRTPSISASTFPPRSAIPSPWSWSLCRPVGPSTFPPLHPINPSETACAQKPGLVFAAEGAPLVFASSLAHDLALHVDTSAGPFDLPLIADPSKGGLVLKNALPNLPSGTLTATVHGKWGFDDWEGPHFHLLSAGNEKWDIAPDDQSALIVGREDKLHIQGDSTLCVSALDLSGNTLTWTSPKPDMMVVSVPLKSAQPGPVTLHIHQYGAQPA